MTRKTSSEKAPPKFAQDKLPRNLREIVDLIGQQPAEQLVARFGGTTITFPRTTHNNQLTQFLGKEVTEKLVRRYSGTPLYVPKNFHPSIATRDVEIYRRYKHGLSNVSQLAREYGISDRRVWNIIRRQKNAALEALKRPINSP